MSWISLDEILRIHARVIDSVEPFFWSIARGEQSVEQIAAWLTANTEPFLDSAAGENP